MSDRAERDGRTASPKGRLRGAMRKAREVVAVDPDEPTSAVTDAERLLASGLFDPWYYKLQTGVEREPAQAVDHYLATGAAEGLLPNPLTDIDGTGLPADAVVAALLGGSARTFPVRELDDIELIALAPAAADHPGGPVGFYLEQAHAGAPVPALGRWSWKKFVRLRRQQSAALTTILEAGVLDREYYEAQAGRTFVDDRAAVWHFLETGESQTLTISPLYERAWYRSKAGVRMPMTFMHLLRTGQVAGAAGPHFDGAAYLAAVPEAADHPGGALGHFVAHAEPETLTVPEPDSGIDPMPWGALRARALSAATQAERQAALLRPAPTTSARWHLAATRSPAAGSGAVAILADAREWGREVPDNLATVLGQDHVDWTLRMAVDEGAPLSAAVRELAEDSRIVLVPTAELSWGLRATAVLETAEEPWTVFWHPQEAWAPFLLSGLLSTAGPDVLAYAAAVDEASGRWWAELRGRESLLWDSPRSLTAMMLPTDRLRGLGLRAEPADRLEWDILLRHDLEPRFARFVGVRGDGLGALPVPAGHGSTYEHVIRSQSLVDWDEVGRQVPERVAGRVSVLVVVTGDRHRTRRAVDRILERGTGDLEVVLVDNGSAPEVAAILAAVYAGDPRVHVRRIPATVHSTVAGDVALANSTGEVVVLLDYDVEVHEGWLEPLIDALSRPEVIAAQALLITEDDSIRSAGFVSAGRHVVPVHLLAGHPLADLPAADPVPDALSSICLAVRADLLVEVCGLDPVFDHFGDVDLSLRLAEHRPGVFATVMSSRASRRSRRPVPEASEADQLRLIDRWGARLPPANTAAWERSGFTVGSFHTRAGLPESRRRSSVAPLLVRPSRLVADGPAAGLPSLRWAVKIAARGGPSGDEWGDTYFADDLVRGLRACGQEAFVDRRGAHERPGADHLDDVTLTLRGRWPAVAQPGATNILWVISHPDEVPLEELTQGFDLVYSAGRTWSEQVTATTQHEVRTLLQATDTSRFTPEGEAMTGLGTLFVGRTRSVMRPIIHDAIEAGADLTIFGDGWEEFIDPSLVAADHLDNDRVPAAYRGARVVLNDHWADMARLGFYSNRLFDAVAAGARVVSDPVDGLEDVLGSSVRTYRTADELRELLDPGFEGWPDAEALAANAARVAVEHSFTARARALLADVLDVRGVPHDLRGRGA